MKNILLLLIIALIVASVGAKRDCNCFIRAVRRCGSENSGIACRNRFVARCARRCREKCQGAVSSPNKCNCFLRAVKRCGEQAENAECRKSFVARCARRCKESCKTTTRSFSGRTIVNNRKRCNCFRRAVSRCGYGRSDNAIECRNRFVARCASNCRETCKTTGRNSFRGCSCTRKATTKCSMFSADSRPDCFNFQVNKCKERCARVRSAINSCECFLRSVRACGARADVDSRSCRNDYVRRCSARCTKAKFFNGCQPNEKSTQDFPNPPNDVLPPLEDRIRITTTRTTFRQLENITYVERDGGRRVRRIFDTTGLDITKEFQSSRRICISESGCNCKTVSTRKCLFANNQATCVQKEMTKCQKRCTQTRRCYALSCKNAGKARCNEVVAKSCAAWFPNDVESQNSCIARETQCCLRRERGLCRRARLTFRFRVECDTAIENICGQFRGAAKCQCVNKYRKDCVADKFKSWRRVVRKFFDCEEATALLCQHKRCGAEHELCVARERSVCEPVCERESRISCDHQVNGPCYDEKHRRCTQKYRFEYCEQRSLITCDGENGCTKRETTLCQNELPECFKNVSMCNDNNACTQDFCDPKLGCVNKQLDCDDNNPCTEDRCDANLGCIHTQKVCNDGKICTRDTCDVTTGQCVYQFDRKMDRRCWPSVLCEDVTNCQEWGRLANLTSKCQEPICDQDLGVCKAVPSTKACPEKCRLNCFPYHQCDAARCEFSEEKKDYVCIHSARDCNDNNDCTRDTCDSRAGCRHEMICPNTTICKIDDDCVAYGKSKNVTGRCLEAFCNANRVCDTRPSGKACPTPICALNCFSNNQCETARCIEVANNSSYCAVTPITCDDKKTCTRDTCHPTFGCKFQFVKSENCPVPCANNKDCKQWGIDEKLEEKCQAPVCNFQSGACEAVTVKENCAFIDFPCPDCRSDDPCVDATCVTTPEGNVCRRTEKKCDDGIECTRDFCQNGQCFHEQIDSPKCRSVCEKKDDCAKMYFEKKLYNTCQDVFCNVTLGACQVVDRETPCITREQCLKNCTAPNPCLTPVCERGLTGDFECKFEQKVCNDGKTCTMDFCDVKNGGCTYPFRKNIKENCFEYCVEDKQCAGFAQKFNLAAECKIARCNLTSGSCQAYPGDNAKCNNKKKCEESCFRKDACDNATCVESTPGVFQCQHKPVTCNDNRKCTEDSCDAVRGCRFTYKVSRECPKDRNCTLQSDCDKLSASLKSKCKKAVCNMEFGRCDEVALDQSCVTDEECEKECPHRNPCEFRSCKKVDGKIQCIRQENTCNDNKDCTLDTCDKVTGKCTHTLIESNPKCKNTKVCEKKAECIQWGKEQKLDTCYEPVCDEKLGVCVAKPNGQMCRDCVKHCPQRSACENTLCFMDVNDRPVCEYTPKVCNDNNECTIDTCQPEVGCVYTRDVSKAKCQSPDCKDKVDCDSWAKDQKLGKCEEAYCELSTKKCIKRLINTPQCNPVNNKCVTECVAKHACETAECVVDPVSKDFKCERQPIKCDDKNKCTVDTCDLVKGCKFTYKVDKNAGCTQECKNMLDCAKWGADNKLSVRCQVPACDDKTTSCYATADPNKKCKPIVEECKLMCKPRNACETADCVRKPAPKSNEFTCVYTPITCDDKKECTRDSCHPVRGCQHVFVRSEKCIPCEKTTDCDAWAQEKKLTEKCQIAVCDTKQGTCVRAAGKQTEKCSLCKESADCPPSKYGSLCCEENGQRKCAVHECAIDSDCKSSNPNQWGYCQQTKCANKCIFKDKCVDNAQCDDGDPCTKDVCVKRYGVCRWIRRCVDGSECTQDICIPSSDNKTYQCRNPVKSCTTIPELLNKNLNDLTQQEKDKWLGKCSHLEGCVSCVVNQQCDDNNGCTADSCEKQFCLHRPIHNEWCDPKLSGQPITYQSIPSLRDPAAWFGRRN